ncbi:MAG: hypothetical protein OXU96_03285 [Gammaproteobacteria bacterium]|nr:hypothetical protein [Gammaproteobacteria bacterium]
MVRLLSLDWNAARGGRIGARRLAKAAVFAPAQTQSRGDAENRAGLDGARDTLRPDAVVRIINNSGAKFPNGAPNS